MNKSVYNYVLCISLSKFISNLQAKIIYSFFFVARDYKYIKKRDNLSYHTT